MSKDLITYYATLWTLIKLEIIVTPALAADLEYSWVNLVGAVYGSARAWLHTQDDEVLESDVDDLLDLCL